MKKQDFLFGLLMFLGFLGYFYLMKVAGLYQNINLRFLNFFIHFGVVFLAMKAYRHRIGEEAPFSFMNTFMAGVKASIPAVVGFALFQYFYLKFLDPGFMVYLVNNAPMGDWLNPGFVGLTLFAEGMVGTFFSSYAGMRLIAAQEHQEFPAL